jgi:hypothetical protein
VLLAIALQNVPEGTTSAIPMRDAGFSPSQQFWAVVATSALQPVGAVVAYILVEQIHALLPVSFAFATGAMLALVAFELVPQAFTARTWPMALGGSRGRRGADARAQRDDRRVTCAENYGPRRRVSQHAPPRCVPMLGGRRGPSLEP